MRTYALFLSIIIPLVLSLCSPKGPQTYSSPFLGKTKKELISAKGLSKSIKIFDKAEAHTYKSREEYFGNKDPLELDSLSKPKKVYEVEHIYYINSDSIVYKYQVWKRKVK